METIEAARWQRGIADRAKRGRSAQATQRPGHEAHQVGAHRNLAQAVSTDVGSRVRREQPGRDGQVSPGIGGLVAEIRTSNLTGTRGRSAGGDVSQ